MKSFGIGVLLLLAALVLFPSIQELDDALVNIFDAIVPAATDFNAMVAHSWSLITLAVLVAGGFILMLMPLIRRGGGGGY